MDRHLYSCHVDIKRILPPMRKLLVEQLQSDHSVDAIQKLSAWNVP